MFRKSLFLAMGLAAALTVSQARAGTVNISTGVATYTVADTLGYNETAIVPTGHYPIPPWVTPPAGTNWIAPISTTIPDLNPAGPKPNGEFDYTTTFTLTNASTAMLSTTAAVSADDQLVAIILNGHTLSTTIPAIPPAGGPPWGSSTLHSWSAPSSDFVNGTNTIVFETKNVFGSVTGLLVSATVTTIPEPASMALLGIGLSGLLTLRRFFKRTSVA